MENRTYSVIDEIHQKNIDEEESYKYMQICAYAYCSAATCTFACLNVSPSLVKCWYIWLLVKAFMLDLSFGGN